MHIPDGFLSNRIWLSLDAVSGATILYCARRLRLQASARLIPLMGVLSAFVFAAQLLNFPILGGTSAHLVGSALLAILLRPLAGFLTMTTVIIAQALFLQDGGLAALGANIFNIAALPVVTGYGIFQITGGGRSQGKGLAVRGFLSGWVSVVVSAVACAFQLALSGVVSLKIGLPAMAGYHAVVGLAEGALTAGVLVFLSHARPDLLAGNLDARLRPLDWLAALVLVAFPCAIIILAGTSDLPDPLQRLLVSAAPVSKPEADSRQLLSPSRYREYSWMIAALSAALVIAWVAARLSRRRGRNS